MAISAGIYPPLTDPPAPCALREAESRGRRWPETAHPFRGEFQRDRDRIIHSRAFRRLENKTQVFPRRYSDHFRNRLTHTLEVTQISRVAATALGLNTELVETLALAHDLGHPPFGHAGEAALDRAMRARGDRFDHNLHALRLVEEFETRYERHRGLNLMFEVREGIIKHSRDYAPAEHPELTEYALDRRPPLEAQLIDWTDEISYNGADLDDAFEARLLGLEQICDEVEVFAAHLPPPSAAAARGEEGDKHRFNEALRGMIDYFARDLIVTTGARAAEFGSSDAVREHPFRVAGMSPRADERRRRLKEFLSARLYQHPRLRPEKERAALLVERVFEFYMERPERLPASYVAQMEREPRHRVVCDFVAGMTDRYLVGLARELGVRAGA